MPDGNTLGFLRGLFPTKIMACKAVVGDEIELRFNGTELCEVLLLRPHQVRHHAPSIELRGYIITQHLFSACDEQVGTAVLTLDCIRALSEIKGSPTRWAFRRNNEAIIHPRTGREAEFHHP